MKYLIILVSSVILACAPVQMSWRTPPSQNQIKSAQDLKSPIAISNIIAIIDGKGGIDVQVTWQNISDKTIKYAYMACHTKNEVGDITLCTIRRKPSILLKFVGPIKPGELSSPADKGAHAKVIYSPTARSFHVDAIGVTYMDGTKSDQIAVKDMLGSVWPVKTFHQHIYDIRHPKKT